MKTNLETEINNGRFSILVYKNDGKGDTILAMAEVGFNKFYIQGFKCASRPSLVLTFNCGSIC